MNKINLLVIAPYKGMDEIIYDLLSTREDVNADCYVANLSDVSTILQQLNLLNYDAVLSRGGTASLIDSMVNIPVYDVGLSALDALRAIRLAQNFEQKIAVIGFENITRTLTILSEVLQYDFPIVTIYSEDEALPKLIELKDNGYSVVVCDVISSQIAPRLGMNAVLVTSGYETIESMLDQAIRLTKRYLQNRQDLFHLTLAFQHSPYACTILDSLGQIVLSSLEINDPNHILPYIREHQKDFLQEDLSDFEQAFHGGILSFSLQHCYLRNEQYHYIYTKFRERPETRKINAIRQLSNPQDQKLDFSYYNSSHYQTSTQDQIERYSRTLSPVIISGETGTGKDQAAYFLYCKSIYHTSIYYEIDCETATDKNWNYLLTHHDSPLMHNKHTLYFRHIDALPSATFYQLMSLIRDTNLAQRNRLIFSFVAGQNVKQSANYMMDLTKNLNCLTLRIPSLRERPDDIPYLCTLYINRLNASLGKQIVGFEPRAMKAMKTFLWESNLDQFQRIIHELMIVTTGIYISYENTMRQLRKESALWTSTEQSSFQFNLEQPLSDITYDIIRQVLREENNNHSQTAKRLEISRSTLWRILKSRSE
ncbi:MAG: PrpR N-terminal domain-containing protein [Eubacteriales bacterium]|nr:PrpR N-terminal domain-containing protein [Eubacteriales bacterium]